MSSHHIVRENQEPALLVDDFYALPEEYLGQILEWSPTIITHSDKLDFFLAQDIKVDILYGEEEILLQEEIKRIMPSVSFIKDSLEYLIKNQYKAVNIFATSVDNIYLQYAEKINIVLFVKGIRYVLIRNVYEKWKSAGQKVFIEPYQLKSLNGVRFIDENLFEVEQDGFITLEFNTDQFVFVGEDI